jgi:hypothetical protein
VYADPPADEAESTAAYYRRLGREAIQALVRIGLPACSGGIMASNPRWCQPLSVWTRYFRQWMDHPACLVGRALVGHTVGFDLKVLARVRGGARLPNLAVDTMPLCGALHPTWRDLTLERVAPELGVGLTRRHTAHGDAVIAGQLLLRLLDRAEVRGVRTIGDLLWLQETSAR